MPSAITTEEERTRGMCQRSKVVGMGSMRIARKPASRNVMHRELAKKEKARMMAITITQSRPDTRASRRGGGLPAAWSVFKLASYSLPATDAGSGLSTIPIVTRFGPCVDALDAAQQKKHNQH